MNWVNDLIGILILLMFVLVPLLRRKAPGNWNELEEEEEQQEESIERYNFPKMEEAAQKMPPQAPAFLRKTPIPHKKKPKQDPMAFTNRLNERQKLLIYKEIFGTPKAFEE